MAPAPTSHTARAGLSPPPPLLQGRLCAKPLLDGAPPPGHRAPRVLSGGPWNLARFGDMTSRVQAGHPSFLSSRLPKCGYRWGPREAGHQRHSSAHRVTDRVSLSCRGGRPPPGLGKAVGPAGISSPCSLNLPPSHPTISHEPQPQRPAGISLCVMKHKSDKQRRGCKCELTFEEPQSPSKYPST